MRLVRQIKIAFRGPSPLDSVPREIQRLHANRLLGVLDHAAKLIRVGEFYSAIKLFENPRLLDGSGFVSYRYREVHTVFDGKDLAILTRRPTSATEQMQQLKLFVEYMNGLIGKSFCDARSGEVSVSDFAAWMGPGKISSQDPSLEVIRTNMRLLLFFEELSHAIQVLQNRNAYSLQFLSAQMRNHSFQRKFRETLGLVKQARDPYAPPLDEQEILNEAFEADVYLSMVERFGRESLPPWYGLRHLGTTAAENLLYPPPDPLNPPPLLVGSKPMLLLSGPR